MLSPVTIKVVFSFSKPQVAYYLQPESSTLGWSHLSLRNNSLQCTVLWQKKQAASQSHTTYPGTVNKDEPSFLYSSLLTLHVCIQNTVCAHQLKAEVRLHLRSRSGTKAKSLSRDCGDQQEEKVDSRHGSFRI